MLLDTHKIYSGFKILRTEFIEEVNSKVILWSIAKVELN
jgi:hypothetical protein